MYFSMFSGVICNFWIAFIVSIVYNKENLERQETNKYGRGTERHLPKTNKSVARPAGECC